MTFDDFTQPLGGDRFMAEVYGRRPMHLKADEATSACRRSVLDWAGLNDLLAVWSHWDARYLKMVMNGRPVLEEHYCETVQTLAGPTSRASLPKVEVFLGMGASLVANQAQEISADIRDAADGLAERLWGAVEANVYCSFRDIQAFGSHYDLHEVFAVQVEGTKTWNLYAHQADRPLEPPPFTDEARAEMTRQRGALMFSAKMEPGDVLYIPRGWFHDALASSDASLHVTFSVTPLNGAMVLRHLQAAALGDPAFRGDLPDHRLDGGEAFAAALATLGEELKRLAASPAFMQQMAVEQRRRRTPPFRLSLPRRSAVAFYRATGRPSQVSRDGGRSQVRADTGSMDVGLMIEPVEWLLTRPAFSRVELEARYRHFSAQELSALVEALVGLNLFEAVD